MDSYLLAEALKRRVRKKIAERAEFIAAGKAEDHTTYKELCGKSAGLREALEILDDIMRNMHGGDDAEIE